MSTSSAAKVRLLHLEDDALDGELVREFLRSEGVECEADRVWTRDGFVRALQTRSYD